MRRNPTEAEWDIITGCLWNNCEELENRIFCSTAKDASEKSEITEVKEITEEDCKRGEMKMH